MLLCAGHQCTLLEKKEKKVSKFQYPWHLWHSLWAMDTDSKAGAG